MKKLFLFIAFTFVAHFFSNAAAHWVMGTYSWSLETGTGDHRVCNIGCNPSSLYCYTTSAASSPSQGDIVHNLNNWQSFEQTGLQAGTPITITVFDALQNVAATYSGNFNSTELSYPADGSIVSTIHFQVD